MATVTEVLNHFRSELGYEEGPNNDNKFAQEVGHTPNLAWCATFVAAMFRRAGMQLPSESPWTPAMFAGLKKAYGGEINAPEKGAVCFLYYPSKGRIAHVGIVESVRRDGRFVTIEGNTSNKVMRRVRDTHGWSFVLPVYDTIAEDPKPPTVVVPPTTPKPRPLSSYVKPIQRALEVKVDGMWGSKTDDAALRMRNASRDKRGWGAAEADRDFNIRKVQEIVDTKVDGIWGPKSQAALVAWIKSFQSIMKVQVDGWWGPKTDGKFLAIRRRNLFRW